MSANVKLPWFDRQKPFANDPYRPFAKLAYLKGLLTIALVD